MRLASPTKLDNRLIEQAIELQNRLKAAQDLATQQTEISMLRTLAHRYPEELYDLAQEMNK